MRVGCARAPSPTSSHDVHRLVDDPLVRRAARGLRTLPELIADAPARLEHPRPRAERLVEVVVQVDRVRRDDARRRRAELVPEHLVDVLEPPLVFQVAEPAERDALVAAEASRARRAGTSASCRRSASPTCAVEDPEPQAVEQDAGAARVVDEDVAVAQVVGELLDGEVEVAVPAVVLDACRSGGRTRRPAARPTPRPGCAGSQRATRTARLAPSASATGALSRTCAVDAARATSGGASRPQPHGVATPNASSAVRASAIRRSVTSSTSPG